MAASKMPDAYIGKEQAYVKHAILKTYLQRLFMIVGQGKGPVINYVDCFAGPWQEEDQNLSNTSTIHLLVSRSNKWRTASKV